MIKASGLILKACILVLLVSITVTAQDAVNETPLPEPEKAEQPQSPAPNADPATELLIKGKYDECLKLYDELLVKEPANIKAQSGKAEVLFIRGDYKGAETLLDAIMKTDPNNLKARLLRCKLYMETGKYAETEKEAEVFTKLTEQDIQKLTSADDLITLAEGLWMFATRNGDLNTFHFVNNFVLPSVEELDKANPRLYTFWGTCYLDKDDIPEAINCFQSALKINPEYPQAILGMAYCQFMESPETTKAILEKLLAINPNYPEALELLALANLAEEQPDEALKSIDKALAINPNSISFNATKASIYYLNNDIKEFDKACAEIIKINPKPALFYYILGNNCASMFRMLYLDAQPFYKKAVELDPQLWAGYIALGLNGLKCGPEAEEEAIKLLEEAHNRDPFHPTVKNTLKLLDAIKAEFVEIKTEHFTIKLNKSEAEMLAPYMTELLEKAYKKFTDLYKFKPEPPLLCEVFPSMNDFSVRMTGLPGVDFALGVCFAKTFLVYSPEVQEKLRKRFHWGTVTVHEFKHIITLQLSKFRVPRWFTEGCSVWSEKLINPNWARTLETPIYQAYESGKLQHMESFTQKKGFDLLHTYLLSSIVIEYIYNKYGMDKIIAMLKGFGERKKQDVVFQECLGKSLSDFDKEFFQYFENDWIKRIKIRKQPRLKEEKTLNERLAKNTGDEEALSALARIALVKESLLEAQELADKALAINPKNTEALITMGDIFYHQSKRRYSTAIEYYNKALASGADDFGTHFKLGISYMKSDQAEKAIKEFNEAKRCFPSYIKYEDNPYYYLATIYENAGEAAKMAKELEDYVKIAYEDFATQMKVTDIYWKENKFDELIKVLENTVYLDPKDIALHARLGLAYWEKKDYAKALREYQVAIFLIKQLEENYSVNQKCSVFYAHMAEIYFESGDKEKAGTYVALALRKDQDNERAANLQKKLKE